MPVQDIRREKKIKTISPNRGQATKVLFCLYFHVLFNTPSHPLWSINRAVKIIKSEPYQSLHDQSISDVFGVFCGQTLILVSLHYHEWYVCNLNFVTIIIILSVIRRIVTITIN